MDKGEYFNEKESELSTVSASYKSDLSEDKRGELICTDSRIVFLHDSEITDINLSSVDAMEYRPANYNMSYLFTGVIISIMGFGIIVAQSLPVAGDLPSAIGIILAILGLGIIGAGYLYQRSSLQIHTPKKSFKFVSSEDGFVDIVRNARRN